jgi:uracil-DNA glycosylase
MVFDHMIEVEISSFRPDLILTLGNTVVENCFTSSVLSSAHLPKDGCEVQVIHGDGHEPLHVLTSFHPSFRKNRIKNKAGEITPAARNLFRLSECHENDDANHILEEYFKKVLANIKESLGFTPCRES